MAAAPASDYESASRKRARSRRNGAAALSPVQIRTSTFALQAIVGDTLDLLRAKSDLQRRAGYRSCCQLYHYRIYDYYSHKRMVSCARFN
jgi:hypothetical protein